MDKDFLRLTRDLNNKVAWALADWVNDYPDCITEEMIREADPEGRFPKDVLIRAIFSGMNDFTDERLDDLVQSHYLEKGIKVLDASTYKSNPYYRNIRLPKARKGGWEFTHLEYKPYEAFVRGDLI